MRRYVLHLILILLLGACASGGVKQRERLRNLVSSGDTNGALAYLESEELFKEEKNKLLYHLEKGSILFEQGQFDQSIAEFELAKDLAAKLYTVSVSKKVAKTFTNDNSDNYYGEAYERSSIHFYLTMAHFAKSQTLSDDAFARESLYRARAELLAWDSVLETMKQDRLGESVFKNDLLAKVWGAIIHETIGTRNDLGTAFILYTDAMDILLKNYNAYEAYNAKAKKFQDDFTKLPKLTLKEVRQNYVEATALQNDLSDFLTFKIHLLAKKVRPNELAKYQKLFPASAEALKMYNEALSSESSAVFVLRQGLIAPKVPEEIYFGLEKALQGQSGKGMQVAAAVGTVALTVFAADILRLTPPAGSNNIGGAYFGIKSAELAASTVAISFELPKIEKGPKLEAFELQIFDEQGKKVTSRSMAVAQPYGDIAEEAVRENSGAVLIRTGTRVALKHAAAIVAAYATYRALKGNNKDNDFIARSAALLEYVAASKGIAATERADTRFWSLLPGAVRLSEVGLAPGKYSYEILSKKDGQSQSRTKGNFTIAAGAGKKYVPLRLY